MTIPLQMPSVGPRESKITSLVSYLTGILTPVGQVGHHDVRVMARSPESPIIEALLRVAGSLDPRAIAARIVFLQGGDVDSLDTFGRRVAGPIAAVEIRLVPDQRYADAHEQVVVPDRACWIGDCVRRDPLKRDGLELFGTGTCDRSLFAMKSFDRFWALAQPMAEVSQRLQSRTKSRDIVAHVASPVVATVNIRFDKSDG